jgi:hypothetical protein
MFTRSSVFSILLITVVAGGFAYPDQRNESSLLLDDFSRSDGQSRVSTRWEGFTDRVMGGRSDMQARVEAMDDGRVLRMTGRVSLENNGGFIQVRLPLSPEGAFDAREYRGVAVTARAAGDHLDQYFVHLRTDRTRLPWSHYEQKMPVTREWRRLELPFSDFEAQNMLGRAPPDVSRLRSVAVVAGKADFTADIQVRSIELYR